MDNPFLKSLFTQPPKILNRQLRPYSAFHAAALMLIDSPYVMDGGPTATIQDAAIGCLICSLDFESGRDFLFPDIESAMECVADDWEFDDSELVTAADRFCIYINDYSDLPVVQWPVREGGDAPMVSPIPWPFFCVSVVLRNYPSFTEAQAWDLPLSRLVSYKAAVDSTQGAEVYDQHSLDVISMAEELHAEIAEEN